MRWFKVLHPDGSEWTNEQLETYAIQHLPRLAYPDLEGVLIDEWGYPYMADECGNVEELDPSDFIVRIEATT